MPTQYEEVFAALAAPFDENEVKTRNQGGRQLSYITARTAANRLDEVLGCENYRQDYRETRNGLICRLWYRLGQDQEWNWKEDGGAAAGMPEADNNEKSGLSDAFKRAAAMLGVGRYLYRDGIPHYGEAPNEPAPQRQAPSPPRSNDRRQHDLNGRPTGQAKDYGDRPPSSGRALFAAFKKLQDAGNPNLIDDVNGLMKRQGMRGRMVDLQPQDVARVYSEAMAMLHGPSQDSPDRGDAYEDDPYADALAN